MKLRQSRPDRATRIAIVGVTLLAFGLRLWRLDSFPPGWRDDELINSLVISQKVLDGDWAVYYPDASGHEALYHLLNAIMLHLFGPGVFGIRWLSVILGTLAIPMTWLVGRLLFGPPVGLVAAAALALSFWSLMYSRIGLRHILVPLLTAATIYFFWRGLMTPEGEPGKNVSQRHFLRASLFMGLGFYTYFASRGLPVILLAFCCYLWLVERRVFKRQWRGFLLMFATAALLSLPLLVTLGRQPETETRVAELAVPLIEARSGNPGPLWEHIRITLNMFGSDGDGEWLYNVPHRPVFGLVGTIFFWAGVATASFALMYSAMKKLGARTRAPAIQSLDAVTPKATAAVLLLLWWLSGIAPAFISVPPASLGHTIMAQPAVFILAALPLRIMARWPRMAASRFHTGLWAIAVLLAIMLLGSIGLRDLPTYFREWPGRGMVRFLYRADIHELAGYLNQHPELKDFGVSGLLAGPWDRLALAIDLDESRTTAQPRWYDPRRAILLQPPLSFTGFPSIPAAYTSYLLPVSGESAVGEYRLTQVEKDPPVSEPVCFENGLCSVSAAYDGESGRLELGWQVLRPLDLPSTTLVSNPPPPGVYAGPRLLVFGQLHDAGGNFLVGDDGLWVDPHTLQPGDWFLQQHWLPLSEAMKPAAAVFGLYDPMTGRRILTEDGRDRLQITVGE
jgi:4-amino-4-deoxy-L-arabinose transferase-like glycosyltransferase